MIAPCDGASADAARAIVPAFVTGGRECPITVDQTNMSIVVDETVIVKWLAEPMPPPHPAVVTLAHLDEIGFREVPRLHGVHLVDGLVAALVQEYLPGALDGWDWYADEFTGVFDGVVAEDRVRHSAGQLGAMAGRLHAALATPSSIIAEPIGTIDLADEAARCHRLVDEALALTTGEPGRHLADRVVRVRATLEPLRGPGATSSVQPVHGDLHVGQFLRSGDRLAVTDFDGNPLTAVDGAGDHRRPTAADVASLLQSIDHVGRVAAMRRPGTAARLEPLVADAIDTCLSAYLAALASLGAADLFDERLLWPFRVAQEMHEFVYAARHLPEWVHTPDATLCSMFPSLAHNDNPLDPQD